MLRPGDLVPVRFLLDTTAAGFYVPVDAITLIENRHVVFAVEEGKARRKEVTVHDTYGEFRRIEGAGLQPDLPIIVGGVHYVSDGQPVSIVRQESLTR